jgi:hypothetical protein
MIRVEIIDPEHPHYEEKGILEGKRTVAGSMLHVKLENCPHAKEGCFVEKDQIKIIKE